MSLMVLLLATIVYTCNGSIPFVITAWDPEIDIIRNQTRHINSFSLVGRTVYHVELDGNHLYVTRGGIGMVNAALTTQAAIDKLRCKHVINAGIAGSMEHMNIGDVSILSRLSPYQENMYYAKVNVSTLTHNGRGNEDGGYGFMYINPSEIVKSGVSTYDLVRRTNPNMMNVARVASNYVSLTRCMDGVCLDTEPKLHVGGTGLSASAFLDNPDWRQWLNDNTDLDTEQDPIRTHDMESASVMHVCETNDIQCMVIRSTSDLAGADVGPNPDRKYVPIAAQNMFNVLRAVLKLL